MNWTWTEEKNRANKRDHGLSFETAKLVFEDPLAVSRLDFHPDGDRWQTVGVVGPAALFVVHTWPEPDPELGEEIGRIISARKGESMKKGNSKPPLERSAELEALAALPEDKINTRDIPEQDDWSGARRGLFFRPVKTQLTLRLDADVIAWFKSHAPNGEGYQTSINKRFANMSLGMNEGEDGRQVAVQDDR